MIDARGRGVRAWARALLAGAAMLVVPLALFLTAPPEIQVGWGVVHKEWLVALYLVGVATFVLLPVAFDWWQCPDAPPERTAAPSFERAHPAGLIVLVALVWYIAGPPWHLDRHHRPIESHEQAHLGPLQAMWKGYPAYVGPASTQYGPGSQVLMYGAIRGSGRFDVVSFRTVWAAINCASYLAVAAVAWWWFGFWSAVAVVVVADLYSPLAFYGTAADGTFAGFYGWANALRYIGALIVAPSVAVHAVQALDERARRRSVFIAALGVLWAFVSWLSQENLSAVALSTGLTLALATFTRSTSVTRALRIARDLLLGFVPAAAAIVAVYAIRGHGDAFVENYFLVPRAVAAGYANIWWLAGSSARRTFYFAPLFVVGLAIAALWRVPLAEARPPMDTRRARFVALLAVQIVCYQVALLRSDSSHLQNTMLAMPFVLVAAFQDAPGWLGTTRSARAVVRLAIVALALAIFPAGRLRMANELFLWPARRFFASESAPAPAAAGGVAFERATPRLSDEPEVVEGSGIKMRTFLEFADDLHALVGTRPAYVAVEGGGLWPSLFYFVADLTPGPYPYDRDTMMIDDRTRGLVVDHIRSHPGEYQCFIGSSLDIPEARAFIESHQHLTRYERAIGGRRLQILIADGR